MKRFMRVKEVAETLGMSVATVWRLSKTDPSFPKPVKVSLSTTGWVSDEVEAYIEKLIQQSRGKD